MNWLLVVIACNPIWWNHTYKHQRFAVIDTCRSFTGTIVSERNEKDGDVHIQLRLDPGQGKPLRHRNMTAQGGCLVVEPVCQRKVTQADVGDLCRGVPKMVIPKVGEHVSVRGVYALDKPHGWLEVHAAEGFEVLP